MNAFAKYQSATTVHKIKALDDAEVTLRDLTLKEAKDIAAEIITGFDSDGNPEIDYEKANDSKMKKISLALVEPKMTITELEDLGVSAMDALDEIFAIVDPKTVAALKKALENKDKEDKKAKDKKPEGND